MDAVKKLECFNPSLAFKVLVDVPEYASPDARARNISSGRICLESLRLYCHLNCKATATGSSGGPWPFHSPKHEAVFLPCMRLARSHLAARARLSVKPRPTETCANQWKDRFDVFAPPYSHLIGFCLRQVLRHVRLIGRFPAVLRNARASNLHKKSFLVYIFFYFDGACEK